MALTQSLRLSRALPAAVGIAVALVVAACNGTAGGAPTTVANVQGATAAAAVATATATATMTPVATATPTVAAPAGPTTTAVPTSIDPCQLFTATQASQVAGVTFAAGKESTTAENTRLCVYGAGGLHVFNVIVAVAPDVATAQAARAAAQAQLSQADPNLHVTVVSGLGDNAATADGSMDFNGKTLTVSGVYVLKGTVFFSLNEVALGAPAAPTVDALKTAAQGIVGQLP